MESFISSEIGAEVVYASSRFWKHGTGRGVTDKSIGYHVVYEPVDDAVEARAQSILRRVTDVDWERVVRLSYKVFPQVATLEVAADKIIKSMGVEDDFEARVIREWRLPIMWKYREKHPQINESISELVRRAIFNFREVGHAGHAGSSWPGAEDATDWWRENWYRAPELAGVGIIIVPVYRCVNPGTSGRSYRTGVYGPTREETLPVEKVTFMPKGSCEVSPVPVDRIPNREPDIHTTGAGDTAGCTAGSRQYPILDVYIL